MPPLTFAALRFALACGILFPVIVYLKIPFPSGTDQWGLILVTGFMQFFLNYGLLFWGGQHITSGLAAVLQATIPAFGLLLARMFIPGERITGLKVISIAMGLIGVVFIFREQLAVNGYLALWGSAAVVIGAFCAAFASVLTKAKGSEMHPAGMVFGQMAIGMVPLFIAGYIYEGSPINFRWTSTAIFCVIYLAIMGSIAAFWLYYWLLTKMDVTRAMMISFVTPLIAVIIGSFFGEKLEINTLLGGILILLSVFLIVIKPLLNKQKRLPT